MSGTANLTHCTTNADLTAADYDGVYGKITPDTGYKFNAKTDATFTGGVDSLDYDLNASTGAIDFSFTNTGDFVITATAVAAAVTKRKLTETLTGCTSTGLSEYDDGTNVSITITCNTNINNNQLYRFKDSSQIVVTGSTATITLSADRESAVVAFKINADTTIVATPSCETVGYVTFTHVNSTYTISPALLDSKGLGDGYCIQGDTYTVTVIPSGTYSLKSVKTSGDDEHGELVTTISGNTFTFIMGEESGYSITINVAKDLGTITVTPSGDNCTISGPTSLTATGNDVWMLTPASGYSATSLTLNGTSSQLATSTTVATDGTITISYAVTESDFTNNKTMTVVGVVAKSVTPSSPTKKFVTIYELNDEGVTAINTQWFNPSAGTTSYPADFIYALNRYPFIIPATGSANLKISGYDLKLTQATVDRTFSFDFGKVKIDETYSNYTNYEPYIAYSIYIPCYGIVNLNAEDVVGHDLQLHYYVNLVSGDGSVILENETTILFINIVSLGMPEPRLGSVSVDGIRASQLAAQLGGKTAYIIAKNYGVQDVSSIVSDTGNRISKSIVVGSVSGYLKADDVNTEGLSSTKSETEEIIRLIKDGIIVN